MASEKRDSIKEFHNKWNHGPLDRLSTEEILRPEPFNSWLLRWSPASSEHVISKKTINLDKNSRYSLDPTSKSSKAKFIHYRVMKKKTKEKTVFYLKQTFEFDSILHLISYYMKRSILGQLNTIPLLDSDFQLPRQSSADYSSEVASSSSSTSDLTSENDDENRSSSASSCHLSDSAPVADRSQGSEAGRLGAIPKKKSKSLDQQGQLQKEGVVTRASSLSPSSSNIPPAIPRPLSYRTRRRLFSASSKGSNAAAGSVSAAVAAGSVARRINISSASEVEKRNGDGSIREEETEMEEVRNHQTAFSANGMISDISEEEDEDDDMYSEVKALSEELKRLGADISSCIARVDKVLLEAEKKKKNKGKKDKMLKMAAAEAQHSIYRTPLTSPLASPGPSSPEITTSTEGPRLVLTQASLTQDRESVFHRGQMVKAVGSFKPSFFDELELHAGDVVEFHRALEKGWCCGKRVADGKVGTFPSNFVEACN